MSEAALRFDAVTRRFGRKTAVDHLDLQVQPGTILGMVGRNGAGKTTSLRLALGMLYPDAGRIRVLGLDPQTQSMEVRTRVALLSEEAHLYPWMTVAELLEFGAAIHPRWDPKLAQTLTENLDLDRRQTIHALSRGSKAKVSLVLGVACRPELLLLDDPTAGLDPLVRREVLQGVLDGVSGEGGAVVYASHLIQDVERVADRVAILDHGRLRLEESLDELKAQVRRVTAVFDDSAPARVELPGQIDAVSDGRVLSVVARGDEEALTSSVRGLGAREVRLDPLSLEEILVACLRQRGEREVDHV